MLITLTQAEAAMASEIGRLRQLHALFRGWRSAHGCEGLGWDEHIEGACGELAVARALSIYWDGSLDTFKADDLPGLQIRTRSKDYYELLVRPGDDESAKWVLVTGTCPEYTIRGWIEGSKTKRPEWLKSYGGRAEAYFVPQSELRPIGELV